MKKVSHPELRNGEIFITNSGKNGDEVHWKTKRVGKVAYCTDCTIVEGLKPVFADIKELEEAGIEIEK